MNGFLSSARRRRTDVAALVYLAGAVTLFFWPLWVAGYRFPQGGGDLWGQLYPVWNFVAEWLRRGVFPLWNYRLLCGDPIFSEGQYGLFNPLNWPLFLTYPVSGRLILVRGAFGLYLAGAGLYLYLRHSPVWRLGVPAALFGATAYMLSDPFITHLGHPQFNDTLAWLPWALWGVDGAARHRKAIGPAGAALALILLAGHGQAALYALLAVGVYSVQQIIAGGRQHGPRRLGRLLPVALLGAALSAPAILPGLERLPLTQRAIVPPTARHGYEFPPAMLVDFITPAFHGRGARAFWPPWDRVESGYVGAVALALAGLGVLGAVRDRRTWKIVALAGLIYDFSLGAGGHLYPLVAHLPLFAESWKTSRAIFLLALLLALEAALGMEHLHRRTSRVVWLWAVVLLPTGAVLLLFAPHWAAMAPTGPPRARALVGLRFAGLLLWGTGVAAWAAFRRKRWGPATLLLLLLAELIAVESLVEVDPPSRTATGEPPALAFLKADPNWFRVDVDARARGLFPPAWLMAQGFEVSQGTGDPLELAAPGQFYWHIPSQGDPVYRLLGAKYIVVPKGTPPGGAGIWPVFVGDPQVDVHLHTGALPRVWTVYRTRPVTGTEAAYAVLYGPDFRPEEVAAVEDGPYLDGHGSSHIEVLTYGPNRAAFLVRTTAPALFVLSDVFYPGWEATVNGEPASIYRTDVIFRGVLLPPGEHRVAMQFRPRSLRLGVALAVLGVWGLAWSGLNARNGHR